MLLGLVSMSLSVFLRDCARVGISALSGACGAISLGRSVVRERVRSCLHDMGFVSREELEVLRECLRRSAKFTRKSKDTTSR
ncbi:hypothetical protein [Candidatus Anaplasma sp. TIGMIC]|uniref:hypothetical protein n=1 Tax=Candidatus Anaplasma sp. TIGMIC TaxID=3020713 RepID=UPI00232DF25F|nr:hypothetical protein [Candidatus Anaplasma sp. TIGMIC]MDB1135797.1 hypothetical protein [Candidatus Anaplasma sp. TIGMIC]